MNACPERKSPIAVAACLTAAVWIASAASATPEATGRFWGVTQYRIEIELAVELNALDAAEGIAGRLGDKIESLIGPAWQASVAVVEGERRAAILDSLQNEGPTLGGPQALEALGKPRLVKADKRIVLAVSENALGVELAAIEYDTAMGGWGPVARASLPSPAGMADETFRLVLTAFSPVAVFRIDAKDPVRAELLFRAGELPRPMDALDRLDTPSGEESADKPPAGRAEPVADLPSDLPLGGEVGEVYRPLLRQLDRAGVPLPQGTLAVPWTYLTVDQPADTNRSGIGEAAVFSHTPRPFSARRRGKTDQIAVRLPKLPGPSRLRLVARDDPTKPLVGYEVFVQDGVQEQKNSLGKTGLEGSISIPEGDHPIQTVYIKSGSALVAKLPIATGSDPLIEAPLLDESARIAAESRLGLLREQLIDVVAQRNILGARTQQAIERGEWEVARELIGKARKLPGPSEFNNLVVRERQLSRAEHPMVQRRIDAMFNDMETVLGTFLGDSAIQDLERSLRAARDAAAPKPAAVQASNTGASASGISSAAPQ